MKPAPTLYVVVTHEILGRKPARREGRHVIQTGFALVEPRVRFATTKLWLARAAAWWFKGAINYDNQALQEHQVVTEDYL